jgi:hypothetical protein
MRIRTIKPEFFTHEAIFDAELEFKLPLRIAFVGLWCAADREGRFRWEPRRLGVQIMPYDKVDFSRVLDALATRGFIRQYRVDEGVFGWIPSFSRHQVINNRERESDLPEPLDFNNIDASSTRGSRVGHAGKEEGKGREGKGKGTREELRSYAVELSLPESDGDFLFDHFEEGGWKRGSQPIKNWKAAMSKWKTGGWLPSQKLPMNGNQSKTEGRGW